MYAARWTDLVPPYARVMKGALRGWYGGEPELRLIPRLCERDELALDIGANRGVYSYFLSRWAGGVVAFEPHPEYAAMLKQAFHSHPRVRVEEVALSDGSGATTLRVPEDRMLSGCATIEAANEMVGEAHQFVVSRRRLDDYELPRVGFIKLDVEGHELSVLEGGKALLTRDRPTLIVEAEDRHRTGAVQSVVDYLSAFGYRGFVCRERHLQPLEELGGGVGLGRRAAEAKVYNFVFIARPTVLARVTQA